MGPLDVCFAAGMDAYLAKPVSGDGLAEAISAQLQAVAETGELGDAKALLRRLETAVDAAQSALSTRCPRRPK